MALPPGMAEWFSRTFKSSGLPAYAMSGPGLQEVRQQQARDYYGPAYASAEAMGLPSTGGLRNYGTNYKELELEQGRKAEDFRPGAGFPGQQSVIDQNYESEKRRAEQLAKQDQLAKKYRVADLTKAYNTASTPEEKEKIGLEIWATTNPQLAQKLKPGQLGYQQVQSVQAAQSPFGGALQAAGNMQFSDKISFGSVPATSFGIGLETPLTGYTVPNVPQVGITESFKGVTPRNISYTEAADLFKGQLPGQADAAILKKIFEQGLKK